MFRPDPFTNFFLSRPWFNQNARIRNLLFDTQFPAWLNSIFPQVYLYCVLMMKIANNLNPNIIGLFVNLIVFFGGLGEGEGVYLTGPIRPI